MEKEIFKDVLNYEGLYQISNYGRVKSLKRENIFYCGLRKEFLKRPVKEKFLKLNKNNRGYLQVCLTKNGKSKTYNVHRLVAETFIENNNNKSQVNHIDGNKENNCVSNLEWCTSSENNKHAFALGLNRPPNKRKVNQYDKQGNFMKQWDCITDFLRKNNKSLKTSHITNCCKGRKKTAYGYKWKYVDMEKQKD